MCLSFFHFPPSATLLDNILLSQSAADGAARLPLALARLESFSSPPPPTAAHRLLPTSLPHSLACARGLMVLECHCCGFFFSVLCSKEYFRVMPRDQPLSTHLLWIHLSGVFLLLPVLQRDGANLCIHSLVLSLQSATANGRWHPCSNCHPFIQSIKCLQGNTKNLKPCSRLFCI